jgi:hypothetical protein
MKIIIIKDVECVGKYFWARPKNIYQYFSFCVPGRDGGFLASCGGFQQR